MPNFIFNILFCWLCLSVPFVLFLVGYHFLSHQFLGFAWILVIFCFCRIAVKKPNKKGSDDINFDDDDDDLLLGLDSPGSKQKKDSKSSDDKGDGGGRPGSAKSVLDDLLGRNLDYKSSTTEQKLSFDSLTYSKWEI